jgi:hypothetical protein
MDRIDFGNDLVRDKVPPTPREMRNSKSSKDNYEFVTKGVDEMLEAGAVSALS